MSPRPFSKGSDASTDVFDAAGRSAVMRRVRSRDTGPERTVRRLLTALGVGYRLHRADLPGRPDVSMSARRLALVVHGCFWHGHDCPRGARVPQQNRDYWIAKIDRNRVRDAAAAEALIRRGWRVETLWECQMKDEAALSRRLADLVAAAPPRSRSARRGR